MLAVAQIEPGSLGKSLRRIVNSPVSEAGLSGDHSVRTGLSNAHTVHCIIRWPHMALWKWKQGMLIICGNGDGCTHSFGEMEMEPSTSPLDSCHPIPCLQLPLELFQLPGCEYALPILRALMVVMVAMSMGPAASTEPNFFICG